MPLWLQAGFWGLLAGGALVVGAAVGVRRPAVRSDDCGDHGIRGRGAHIRDQLRAHGRGVLHRRSGRDRLRVRRGSPHLHLREFAGQQEGTGVTPGDRLSLEWGSEQKLGPRWRFGGSGYFQWQVTEATGISASDARDRVYAAGGQLAFWPVIERLFVSGRLLAEFAARDRFQGLLGTFTLAYTF